MVHAVQECIFIKYLLKEILPISQEPINVKVDNEACFKLSYNPEGHNKSKHVDIKFHYIQDLVERKQFQIEQCSTKQQTADICTKALPIESFEFHRKNLQMMSLQQYTAR